MYGTYTGASYFFPFGLAVCIIFKNSAGLQLGIFLPWKQKIFMQRTETKSHFTEERSMLKLLIGLEILFKLRTASFTFNCVYKGRDFN